VETDYAVQDTRTALLEAQRQRITPFCLTVDTAGHDYMQAMCADIRYAVLDGLEALPLCLPRLYRTLTS
jgi:nitric oxide reductase NorD protein